MLEIEFHFKLTRKPKAKKILFKLYLNSKVSRRPSKFLALAIKFIVCEL